MARLVDATLVDDARLDETAQFEDVVPVTSVSRDARRHETEHRSEPPGAGRRIEHPGGYPARPHLDKGDRNAGKVLNAFKRIQYLEMDPPLRPLEAMNVVLITNTVEVVFFLISELEMDRNPYSREEG